MGRGAGGGRRRQASHESLINSRLEYVIFPTPYPIFGPGARFSKVPIPFRARKAVLCLICRVCIQDQSIINFENDTMKLSFSEPKLTDLWARNCATFKWICDTLIKQDSGTFSGCSRNFPTSTLFTFIGKYPCDRAPDLISDQNDFSCPLSNPNHPLFSRNEWQNVIRESKQIYSISEPEAVNL